MVTGPDQTLSDAAHHLCTSTRIRNCPEAKHLLQLVGELIHRCQLGSNRVLKELVPRLMA